MDSIELTVPAEEEEVRGEEDDVDMMVTDDLETENTTEFHINLDKCPPSLQNTLINEKVYINEKYKSHLDEQGLTVEIDSEKLKELYDSLGLTEGSFDTETNDTTPDGVNLSQLFRRDGLHLHGVDELKTQDIFDHFGAYNPYSLEWINDSSCNMVWKSERLLLKALIECTGPYDPNQRSDKSAQQPRIFMRPPKNIRWRITNQPAVQRRSVNDKQLVRELNHIFVRFVRKHFDRKRKGAESKSMFYVKYGNPNYGNLKGLISDSKRRNLRQQQMAIINTSLDDASRIGPVDHQDEEEEDNEEEGNRKLISYNFELSGLNEIEEFGTGSSPVKAKKPIQAVRQEQRRPKESRPVFKKDMQGRYKKMYMDEVREGHDRSPNTRRSPHDRVNRSLSRNKDEFRELSEERSDERHSYKRKNEPRIDSSDLRSRLSGVRGPIRQRSRSRSPRDDYDDGYYESRRKRRSGRDHRRGYNDYSDEEEDNRRWRRGGPRSSVKSVVVAPDDLRNRLSNIRR